MSIENANAGICILQETKPQKEESVKSMDSWKNRKGYIVNSEGASRGLGILWNPCKVDISVMEEISNWIVGKCKTPQDNDIFYIISVYYQIRLCRKRRFGNN